MKLAEGRQETRSKLIVVNSSEVAFRVKRGILPGFRLREAVSSNAEFPIMPSNPPVRQVHGSILLCDC